MSPQESVQQQQQEVQMSGRQKLLLVVIGVSNLVFIQRYRIKHSMFCDGAICWIIPLPMWMHFVERVGVLVSMAISGIILVKISSPIQFSSPYKAEVCEIILGSSSITICIPTLTIAVEQYRECVKSNDEEDCYESVVHLLTAQGVWTGVFVIIAGCIDVDLGKRPNNTKVSFCVGFSVASAILSLVMLSLEAAALDHHEDYIDSSDDLRSLHITLLILSLFLMFATFFTSGISLAVIGFWRWMSKVADSCLEDPTYDTNRVRVLNEHRPTPTAPACPQDPPPDYMQSQALHQQPYAPQQQPRTTNLPGEATVFS